MYWLKCLIRRIQRIYGYDVHVIHTDGERGFGNELQEICSELGMLLEVLPTATHEANGFIEKQNDILTLRARALRISSNLPEDLANECYLTAAYLLNRTPIEALKWKTPYEVIYGRKPLVGHMHPFGCKAYCLNRNLAKANKTASRALIGHLVGYRGTNVFKVYLLGGKRTDPILYTRDAIFDDQKFYTGLDGFEDNEYIREEIELLEYPMPFQEEEVEHEELLTRLQQRRRLLDGPPAHDSSSEHVGGETQDQDQAQHQAQLQTQLHKRPKTPDPQQLLTPEPTDLGGASTTPSPDDDEFTTPTPGPSNRDEYPLAAPPEYRPFGEKAPKDISADFSLGNVVTGKRQRKQPDAFAATLGYINYVPLDGVSLSRNYSDIPHYLSVFTAELTKPAGSVNNDIPRVHQTQLPKPPRFVKDLKDHAYSSGFKVALTKEWLALRSKGCFKSTTLTKATVDAECLPLMWVFTYKIAEDGYLLSFKARLVVRGDLQDQVDDTYAATLAIRNFRAMVAIANHFDLHLKQYDVPTAFLNAKMNRKLYARVPDGVGQWEQGEIMVVLRALYGLKESPKLWFNALRIELLKLGLQQVPGFPCLYTNKWLIFFVYVDDIVMAYHEINTKFHIRFEQQLIDLYDIKPMGDLKWFLGIRFIRDRAARKSWLIQDAFIDKACSRFDVRLEGKKPDIPIVDNWLDPSNEEPHAPRTKLYQQVVGSLAYIAVWGRPDVARAHVILASHLINPGQAHLVKALGVWRYLLATKGYALQASHNSLHDSSLQEYHAGCDPLFIGASDASFADHPETRRSSQGYLFKFGGMTIDWKSCVQRTVSKSTTESELLALSLAGSQMEEWIRFFKGIRLTIDCKPTILCDNQQTVGIVNKSEDKLHTKVKHVDIHQLWIRQEVQAERLNVIWTDTNSMPADGLTKALPKQKFSAFVHQLGLVDVTYRLKGLRDFSHLNDPQVYFPNSL
jgi:hypothetical protein